MSARIGMKILCRHCGLREDEHHEFEALMPAGCQCAPGEWLDEVWQVCDQYLGDGIKYCLRCEHDPACHVGAQDAVRMAQGFGEALALTEQAVSDGEWK